MIHHPWLEVEPLLFEISHSSTAALSQDAIDDISSGALLDVQLHYLFSRPRVMRIVVMYSLL